MKLLTEVLRRSIAAKPKRVASGLDTLRTVPLTSTSTDRQRSARACKRMKGR